LNYDIELPKAPEMLEDGRQAIVDELKELYLRTAKESRPIYVSTMLTSKEEEKYFTHLSEYKNPP